MVRVLGIDYSKGNTGWAVVRKETRRYRCVDSRYIQTSARLSLGEWLGIIEGHRSRVDIAGIIGIENVYCA